MTRRIVFHPAAAREVTEARAHYAEVSPELADAFVAELSVALDRAASLPQSGRAWSRRDVGRRVYLLKRFPYVVIARADTAELRVVAVAHQRRKPAYWQNRER